MEEIDNQWAFFSSSSFFGFKGTNRRKDLLEDVGILFFAYIQLCSRHDLREAMLKDSGTRGFVTSRALKSQRDWIRVMARGSPSPLEYLWIFAFVRTRDRSIAWLQRIWKTNESPSFFDISFYCHTLFFFSIQLRSALRFYEETFFARVLYALHFFPLLRFKFIFLIKFVNELGKQSWGK